MLKLFLTFSACMMMSAPLVFAQQKATKSIPSSFYVEKNEIQLSEAINKFRAKKGLGELQLSPSLCYVAKTHLNDIRLHSKNQHGCNLNSWSDKGKWTPCCFNGKQINMNLMTSKPAEIVGFRGKGFEIVIAAKKDVSTKNLADLWLNAKTTTDFLLSMGKWSNHSWQSMGVSIYHGFASIWFSEMPDRITDIPLANKSAVKIADVKSPVHSVSKTDIGQETVHTVAGGMFPDTKSHKTSVSLLNQSVHTPATTSFPEKTVHTSATVSLPEQHVQTNTAYKPDLAVYSDPNNHNKGTSYFLVHSSYTSLKDAMKTFESLKAEGFKNLVMIDARGKYRVALGIYTTEAAAQIAMRKNYPRFTQLKIYVF